MWLEAVLAPYRIWAWKSIGPVQSGEYPLSVNGIKTWIQGATSLIRLFFQYFHKKTAICRVGTARNKYKIRYIEWSWLLLYVCCRSCFFQLLGRKRIQHEQMPAFILKISYCRTRACQCRPPAATAEAACGRRTTRLRASAQQASRGRGARWPAIPAPPWPAPSTPPAPSPPPALRSAHALQAMQVGFNKNIFRFDWISIPNEFSIFHKVLMSIFNFYLFIYLGH